jgi:CheY-like chemotaxis protein/DNA-binding XRE family transcriptional regulator
MKKLILLIEDDAIVRENTAEILCLANYQVQTAENGKVGIEMATQQRPDLIICDILMPVLDGFGVLQIVLRNEELKRVPFIFMSAKTDHSDLRKGMDLGASDYITKPFEESELLSAIETRLKLREGFELVEKEDPGKEILYDDLKKYLSSQSSFFYPKGSAIYLQDNLGKDLFYIISGKVKTFKYNDQGKEFITSFYNEGDYFGFTPFQENKTYNENALAVKQTKLIKLSKSKVLSLIRQNPVFSSNFIEILISSLENMKEHLIHMAYDSVRKKTADKLLELLPEESMDPVIEISRTDLASIIGIAKETLIRTLKELKEEEIIQTGKKFIRIMDLNKLKTIK